MNQSLSDKHQAALAQLLQQARWSDAEIRTRLQQALSPDYWAALNPQLAVNQNEGDIEIERPVSELSEREQWCAQLASEGYFQTAPLIAAPVIECLRQGIEVLRAAGWPPLFAFIYDECWRVMRGPAMTGLLTAVLGAGYQQMAQVYTFYVQAGGSGWFPHVDYGPARRLTLWLALSDATLENGCLYLIPRHRTPPTIAENFSKLESVSYADLLTLLHNCRAVPAPTGTLLGWGNDLIHWGAHARPMAKPRISLAMNFVAADFKPAASDLPLLLDARQLPTLAQRLRIIAHAIEYARDYAPWTHKYLDFAKRLIAAVEQSVP